MGMFIWYKGFKDSNADLVNIDWDTVLSILPYSVVFNRILKLEEWKNLKILDAYMEFFNKVKTLDDFCEKFLNYTKYHNHSEDDHSILNEDLILLFLAISKSLSFADVAIEAGLNTQSTKIYLLIEDCYYCNFCIEFMIGYPKVIVYFLDEENIITADLKDCKTTEYTLQESIISKTILQ